MNPGGCLYMLLVPVTGICILTATFFLISGIMHGDGDVIESIKLYINVLVNVLILYIPYRMNHPSPKKIAFYKEKYEDLLLEMEVPETAKTIVISECDKYGITEKVAVIWRGATSLYALVPSDEPKTYEYPLSEFTSIIREETCVSKPEKKILEKEWRVQDVFLKTQFFILRPGTKKHMRTTYKTGSLCMSAHSLYNLMIVLKPDLSNISFGDGRRIDLLEQYYSDGAVPHHAYVIEKNRIEK